MNGDNKRGDAIGDLSDLMIPSPPQRRPDLRIVDEVATSNGFPSRPPQKRTARRHRTGRDHQLNVRVSQEALDAFVDLSNRRKWIFSQTIDALLAVFAAYESGRLVSTGKSANTGELDATGELAGSWPPRL